MSSLRNRGLRAADQLGRRLPPAMLRMAVATAKEFRELEVLDRAMTLAAQAFTSIFPLIIAIAALRAGHTEVVKASISGTAPAPVSCVQAT